MTRSKQADAPISLLNTRSATPYPIAPFGSDALTHTVSVGHVGFSAPAQFAVVFGGQCPEGAAGVLLSTPDTRSAAQIAAAIGRTPTENEQ